MGDLLHDRWTDRDLPVLVAAATGLEAGARAVTSRELSGATGLDRAAVVLAVAGLADVYLEVTDASSLGGRDFLVTGLTERGRRAVGIWPSGDQIDALIDALRQAEGTVTDPEERTALRRAASALGSISREVIADIISAMARAQAGL